MMNKNDKSTETSYPPSDLVPLVPCGPSPYDDDLVDMEQDTYGFRYFLALARYICRDVSDADLQDIAQEAWISFTRKSKKGNIYNSEAYIAQIIRNKFRDYLRQVKRHSRLPTISLSTYAENLDIELVTISGEGLINPANELNDQMEKMDFLSNLAIALPKVAPRQRRAMICTLLDKVDDPLSLKQLLKSLHIDTSERCWPSDKAEKRLLKASLPAARRTLANLMQIDLYQYKWRKPTFYPPTIRCHTIHGDATSMEAK
jgi:RNA polymerase sigma factor (sigma-70 family)